MSSDGLDKKSYKISFNRIEPEPDSGRNRIPPGVTRSGLIPLQVLRAIQSEPIPPIPVRSSEKYVTDLNLAGE